MRAETHTMSHKKIQSALISVFNKDGLDRICQLLKAKDIVIYSTGGTFSHLEKMGLTPRKVEDVTGYPSILDGRVKTLHPKIFGGILARREQDHLDQLNTYEIPEIDLVVVDLYPFEDTVKSTSDESAIIEKIDIGGISLIRAAAKNYRDLLIIPSKDQYAELEKILDEQDAVTDIAQRKALAAAAFNISSHYDSAIFNYFNGGLEDSINAFKHSLTDGITLRYGENPHQTAEFYGNLSDCLVKRSGKELSFNNLVDVDAAVQLMAEFKDAKPSFAILKHTNACGLASRDTVLEAWHAALAGDPVSAFGGILICNHIIDLATAEEIDKLFYEVLLAPGFDDDAFELLRNKKKRVLIEIKEYARSPRQFKSLLNGVIVQDADLKVEDHEDLKFVTGAKPGSDEIRDLLFANKLVKHLKSNTIVMIRDEQLLGMGCGQTSRIDACHQAIDKAGRMGFELEGAVMASDAFFPFPDCVEIAYKAGIKAVIQPGGSINDQQSIDFCDQNGLAMVLTGIRHFKH